MNEGLVNAMPNGMPGAGKNVWPLRTGWVFSGRNPRGTGETGSVRR